MITQRSVVKLVSVLAVAGSVAGVAVAASSAPPAPEPAVPQQRSAETITAVDVDQESLLGVLRRPLTNSDALAAEARPLVARGSGPALGANPQLARLALTTPLGERLYVVPARGWVCLASSVGTGNCTPTGQLADGYSVSLQGIPSGFRLSGIVPDGVGQVEVRGDADTMTAAVTENVWQADVPFTPSSVSWTGSAGEKVVPVAPPSTLPSGPSAPASALHPPGGGG